MKTTHCSLKEKMERFPPVVCFLLARTGGPTSSDKGPVRHTCLESIACSAGISLAEALRLSWQTSWGHETVDTMLRFTSACGIDFDDRRSFSNNWKFLRRQVINGMPYLRRDKDFNRDFKPRIDSYLIVLSNKKQGII